MQGLMQQRPLTVPMIFHRMEEVFPQSLIKSVRDSRVTTMTYAEWGIDVRRVANALKRIGLDAGARVATLCPNTVEHLTLYYAVPCAGYVLHTVNHRLSAEHIAYIIKNSDARVLVVDSDIISELPTDDSLSRVELIVVVGKALNTEDPRIVTFESLLDVAPYKGDFVIEDED